MSSNDAHPVRKHHVNLLDTMKQRKTGERGTDLQCFLGTPARNLASFSREYLLSPREKQITMLIPSAPCPPRHVSVWSVHAHNMNCIRPSEAQHSLESLALLHTNYMTLCISYKAKTLRMHPASKACTKQLHVHL